MVVQITNGNIQTYSGLSTDNKPTANITDLSQFYELDTKLLRVFSTCNINPSTSNGWW
jgi:hypothetical protein